MKTIRLEGTWATVAVMLAVTGCPGDDSGGATDTEDTSSTSDGNTLTTTGPSTSLETTSPETTSPETGSSESSSTEPGTTETGSTETGSTESGSSESGSSTIAESSSGSSESGVAGLPDIDMTLVAADMEASVYTETRDFAEDDCALSEMCINAAGTRRLLRFDSITPNVGDADFVVGNPDDNPENFEFAACHNHYHFLNYANYRLLDGGVEVASGHKQSFALIDLSQFDPEAGPGQYPLPDGTQGITVGWADIYSSVLDCQWVDITDVPPGDYQLEIEINFDQLIEESDFTNNLILLDVTIDESDPPPPMVPDEWTCTDDWYQANDGCDCGCGALDPDCDNPMVDACDYCGLEGTCNEGDNMCAMIDMNSNWACV